MKLIILILAAILSINSEAFASNNQTIQCSDGLYVGYTSVEIVDNKFSIHKEDYYPYADEPLSMLIGSGNTKIFYSDDNVVILDLYENLEKVGTLIATNSGWGASRLEYKGKILGRDLNCSIRGK